MSDQADINPYAPPKTDVDAPGRRAGRKPQRNTEVEAALARLREHVADRGAVANDLKVAGPRVRPHGWVSGLICATAIGGILVAQQQPNDSAFVVTAIGGGIAVFAAILGIVFVVMDLQLVPRDHAAAPDATLKSFYKSISMGRHGYAWSMLCPTAREQMVRTPNLDPVHTIEGDFPLDTDAGLKAYVASFARPGQGTMRTMAIKRAVTQDVSGDVATIDVELRFQSWPQWVTIIVAVGFIVFKPIVLIGAVLYFVMRKKHDATFTKTMLRAENGVWYVLDGDVVEAAAG